MIDPPDRAERVATGELDLEPTVVASLLAARSCPASQLDETQVGVMTDLAEAALGRSRLDQVTVTIGDIPSASGHQVVIPPHWFDAVWCWGAAVVDGSFVVDSASLGPGGRPGRLRVVAGEPGGLHLVERGLRVDARHRWHLVVF